MQSLLGNSCCTFMHYVPLRPDFWRYWVRMRPKFELPLSLFKEGLTMHNRFHLLLLWWGLLVLQDERCLWWRLLLSPQQYNWILSSSMVDDIQNHTYWSWLCPFLLYLLLCVLVSRQLLLQRRGCKLHLSISWYERWELHKMAKGL